MIKTAKMDREIWSGRGHGMRGRGGGSLYGTEHIVALLARSPDPHAADPQADPRIVIPMHALDPVVILVAVLYNKVSDSSESLSPKRLQTNAVA